MVEHVIDQTLESAIIDDGQHAERAIVQFIGSDIAGKESLASLPGTNHDFFGHLQ
jgi:hypothetical protein